MQEQDVETGMVARALEEAMRRSSMSAAQLARATGVSKASISLILSGKRTSPTAANVARLADALGVSADYLLGLSNTPEPTSLMLGELIGELTQVARGLSPARQHDLLLIARAFVAEAHSKK